MLKVFSILLIFTLLSACSSNHKTGVVYHEGFDFSQVKNYSFYHRNSAFTDSQNLIDARRNAIEIAIERTMENNNFNYLEPEQADVVVTYYYLMGTLGNILCTMKWYDFVFNVYVRALGKQIINI
eukprot:TRINITY_DN7905_c1_g1_i1.p1 TRINITY_DN7905_c1_g1~~TRINITY_DN7905_c1_g1_i1.p1  ORF type:complete len:125 (+),score=6.61 TRINITY_DN7905_c1_g1_i1:87-461(+)